MPRASKSDAEKAASGTLQPCRRSRSIVISDATLTETPPVGLTKDAREAWKLAIACAPKGMLTALDVTVLERWARNYALYRKIAKQLDHEDIVALDEEGNISDKLNPRFNALIKVQQVLAGCEKELGFTPVSRARVKADPKDEEQNEYDGF